MTIKEFAAKQIALQLTPLIGGLSDSGMGKFLFMAKKLAPTEFTKSFIDNLDQMRINHDPMMDFIKRMIHQTNPRVRERIINNMVIKELMQGDVIRHNLWLEGNASTQTFLISPTMRCNLHCTGCFAGQYSQKDDLEIETIDRIITEGEELGMFLVTILGGEPLIRQDMLEIYQRHRDVLFQIFTNGTLITEKLAAELAKLGNVIVTISLEGFEEETDKRRGKGTFQKVMRGMDLLRENGIPLGFSVMITRHNVDTIISESFNDMLIEKGCLIGWHFLYIPTGRNPDASLMPTAEQRELLRQKGAAYIRKKKPVLIIDFWNDAPIVKGCIAGGQYYFHINARGDVEPCVFLHVATDNIKQKSLKEAINSPFFRTIRSHQPFSHNLLRPCMIIDHPQVLRNICAECKPYSTDSPVCGFITSLAGDLDRYSEEVAKILDPVWECEYSAGPLHEACHEVSIPGKSVK
jgi:MoaA/NifB/PqqE/SkfB family radical SAM enzyme